MGDESRAACKPVHWIERTVPRIKMVVVVVVVVVGGGGGVGGVLGGLLSFISVSCCQKLSVH